MLSTAKNLFATNETPSSERYLKLFRVNRCRAYRNCSEYQSCFSYHTPSQRRRPSFISPTGEYNYCCDKYCIYYTRASGTCPSGDACPYLHRTVGDSERLFHVKIYKTIPCPYLTDANKECSINGSNCPYAHGRAELRTPVLDVTERFTRLQVSNVEDTLREQNLSLDDPVNSSWGNPPYMCTFYKTKLCAIPPSYHHLGSGAGQACQDYHSNWMDNRRSFLLFKYVSTPCPNVRIRHGSGKWGSPLDCPNGMYCPFSHTRVEQQYHFEVYKTLKCREKFGKSNYCPRGIFCAFAHTEREIELMDLLRVRLRNGEDLGDIARECGYDTKVHITYVATV